MSSIGKVNASFLGATQETTLALANINFDFSLCKVEAPTEYQTLGKCLSKRRLNAAENGNEHIVARKLGALFSGVLGATPNLVKAYGKRASEIAAKVSNDNGGSSAKRGIFDEWQGPDATSIWAAATSSSSAISAHLLACMLARVWTASEAEAIWDEIIHVRKRLLSEVDDTDHMKPVAALAAQIEVTRAQISSWDASARAWLEVADKAMLRQQKQLLLLVENPGIPFKQSPSTYDSVTNAWLTALTAMESAITGVPQSIQDASVLLALRSWHLYPDLFVLGVGHKPVEQNDHLLPKGAMITLGHSSCTPDGDGQIRWSLPLAYLKYYGDPVKITRTIGETTSRLSITEFAHVIFGSVLANWGEYGANVPQAAKFFVTLNDYLAKNGAYLDHGRGSWVKMLSESAEAYLVSQGTERQIIHGLIMRGHRRYKDFLSGERDIWQPLLGIADVNTLLQLITDGDIRVEVLRLVAQGLAHARPDSLIIRYPRPEDPSEENSQFSNALPFEREASGEAGKWEYATALPRGHNSKKRKIEPVTDLSGHARWTSRNPACLSGTRLGEDQKQLSTISVASLGRQLFKWSTTDAVSFVSTRATHLQEQLYECILGDPDDAAIFKRVGSSVAGSELLDVDAIITVFRQGWIDVGRLVSLIDFSEKFKHPRVPQHIHCLRAVAAAADVYKLTPGATLTTHIFSSPLRDALWIPSRPAHQPPSTSPPKPVPDPDQDLKTRGSLIYGTTVDPRLLSREPSLGPNLSPALHSGSGLRPEDGSITHGKLTICQLTRPQVFSCIAMFENRSVNLNPGSLEQVMAISTGNSMYVSMPLVCDPFESPGASEVKHIVGNIGKPGINFMIPPIVPKVRQIDESEWVMINHADFDGQLDDAFEKTSLHLSFTRYSLPVKSSHGYQGIEANFVETLVSIFDRNKWVGDVDILRALSQPFLARIGTKDIKCGHKRPLERPRSRLLTSIDSWDEFFDRPQNPSVVRSCGNWLGRLSAAVLNAQLGHETIVLEDGRRVCWECVFSPRLLKPPRADLDCTTGTRVFIA